MVDDKTFHRFDRSLDVEARWAPVLDRWVGESYPLRDATASEQRSGIDRVAIDDRGRRVGIDYKCDTKAERYGNIFVETVSVDTSDTPGWVLTTQAEWIFYFVVPSRVLVFITRRLRKAVASWRKHYPTKPSPNVRDDGSTYHTLGVCVPIDVAAAAAEYTASLADGDRAVLQARDRR